MRDVAHLQRSAWDRKLAGVAGGIGRHLDIDPTVVRVLLVVLCFFGGAGFLLYAAGWLLVPDERTGRAVIPTSDETRTWLLLGGLVLVAVIALGGGWGGFGWAPTLPLVVLALLGVVVLVGRDARRSSGDAAVRATSDTGVDSGVDSGVHPRAAWAPPPYVPPAERAALPRRPRRTGLVLFWPTLALIVVALGSLGIYDATHAVEVAAYPALALAVIGVMLVVGAFRGRPGGLVLLGVVAALTLAVSSLTGGFAGASSSTYDPRTVSEVRPAYSMQTGELVLNLSNLDDVTALDGRGIDVAGDTGELLVIVPRDLRVDVDAEIDAVGGIDIGAVTAGGIGPMTSHPFSGSANAPVLHLDLHLQVGHIQVRNDHE